MNIIPLAPTPSARFSILLSRCKFDRKGQKEKIAEAFAVASEAYASREHCTGMSLLDHTLGVLEILLSFGPDDEAVCACLLHHALDSRALTLDDIEERFGVTVRSIVSGAHILAHVTGRSRRMSMENLRLMLLRVSDDIRVILLVLCDMRHLLEHLSAFTHQERRRVARDALHLFAPVAARLGIYSLKHQLEAVAFPVAYPTDAERINSQLTEVHQRYGSFLDGAASTLQTLLTQEGLSCRVEGREKQPYSIFGKMRSKATTSVSEIYDLFALRVIVDDESSCYQALGLLHRLGHPVANRFKDYIAFPKPNGYQSLHATLVRLPNVPDGIFIEVQVRTEEMHREAEFGLAAHWSYKEEGATERAARKAQVHKALTVQQSFGGPKTVFGDHIFVLTPKGDIVELPEGATPLDFAFQLHTAIGLSFRAARVNGSIVPLSYELQNGDIVEILKYRDPHPSPRWITLLKTASARSRLKRYLATADRVLYLEKGREALNEELRKFQIEPLDASLALLRAYEGKELTMDEREDLLTKIGHGALLASYVVSRLDALRKRFSGKPKEAADQRQAPPLEQRIVVAGDIRMPVRLAKCCMTQEKKTRLPIRGVISRGAVRVHRADCKLLKLISPERAVDVSWADARLPIARKA